VGKKCGFNLQDIRAQSIIEREKKKLIHCVVQCGKRKGKSLNFVKKWNGALVQNYFSRQFLVLSLVVLGKTHHLLVYYYELLVAVSASVAVVGRLTAQMLWNGMNMIPVVVRRFGVVEEGWLVLLGWTAGTFYNNLIWRIFDMMGKAFSKRLSIPQNLTANTESFRIAIRLQNFYNQLPTSTTKSG
jgi:hypothetical protein